jgi:glyoxylase-like metal-dependent hydrolase (beta-lactamase superfamily II)
VECIPADEVAIRRAGLSPDDCARQLHVIAPQGLLTGWDAVAYLARIFPATWLIGALGSVPPFRWAGQFLYGWVAKNRYALSKCRGGSCRSVTVQELESHAPQVTLIACHWFGLLLRLPLSVGAILRQVWRNCRCYARIRNRRMEFPGGHLQLCMLNGLPCDLISLLFGEYFVMIVYDGIAIDPGPTRLRRALLRHLRRLPANCIHPVVATHHHEEHAGNLNWLAEQTGAALYVGEATAECLRVATPLPWIRNFMIGARPELTPPYRLIGQQVCGLEAFPTPGHCDDHICLYDREEKILFAGDSFMGTYFSAPNPDVDSRSWIATLRKLLELDIEILIEGHGHIHKLRPDIPDTCPLVVREDPRQTLREKLRFIEWMQDQIDSGLSEGLSLGAVELTCFPWGRRFSWENFWNDELTRLLSQGHWSRTEMIRSFVRPPGTKAVLPVVYEARLHHLAR